MVTLMKSDPELWWKVRLKMLSCKFLINSIEAIEPRDARVRLIRCALLTKGLPSYEVTPHLRRIKDSATRLNKKSQLTIYLKFKIIS